MHRELIHLILIRGYIKLLFGLLKIMINYILSVLLEVKMGRQILWI